MKRYDFAKYLAVLALISLFLPWVGAKAENGICALEDVLELEKYIDTRYGEKLTFEDVKELQSDFVTRKDDFIIDPRSLDKQKIRFTGLSKSCKSEDGVEYELLIVVLTHLDGSNNFQEFYIYYDKNVFLTEKRPFSFPNMYGSHSDYQEVLSFLLVGKLNRAEANDYLGTLGCSFKNSKTIEKRDDLLESYVCIDTSKALASMVAMHDFTKKIISVSFNEEDIVNKIQIK
jgi:hypothetical protein